MFEMAPLREPGFRRLWVAGTGFRLATGVRRVAVPWLVLELTGSPLQLGVALALGSVDALFAPLLSGAVDRFSRRLQVAVGFLTYAGALGSIPVAAALGRLSIAVVYGALAVAAAANFAAYNARHALLPDLVDDGRLDAANALVHGAGAALSLTFLALGGAITGTVGAVPALAVGGSVAAVATVPLLGVPEPGAVAPEKADADAGAVLATLRGDLADALRLVRGTVVADLVWIGVAVNLVMPAFGLLFAAVGHGVFDAALAYTALLIAFDGGKLLGNASVTKLGWSRTESVYRGLVLTAVATAVVAATGLFVGRLHDSVALAGITVAVGVLGATQPVFNVPTDSAVQTAVPPDHRGKVLTLTNALLQVTFPVAYLGGGWVVGRTSPFVAFGGAAGLLGVVAAAARWRLGGRAL